MSSATLFTRSTLTTINGEPAVALQQMPESWRRIAQGTWMTEPRVYTAMAQVFLAKNLCGHVLFLERSDTHHLRDAYCEGNGKLAWEAVCHFGEMFLPENYPNLARLHGEVQNTQAQQSDRIALVNIVSDLFDALGYDVPATFYWTFLHP